jgi:hypothetical protein
VASRLSFIDVGFIRFRPEGDQECWERFMAIAKALTGAVEIGRHG